MLNQTFLDRAVPREYSVQEPDRSEHQKLHSGSEAVQTDKVRGPHDGQRATFSATTHSAHRRGFRGPTHRQASRGTHSALEKVFEPALARWVRIKSQQAIHSFTFYC